MIVRVDLSLTVIAEFGVLEAPALQYAYFAQYGLLGWNLEDREGWPVKMTADAMLRTVPHVLAAKIVEAWSAAVLD